MVDLGTGDGRFAYEEARLHPETLYVGVDADASSLRELSGRAARPGTKGAPNAIFIVAAAEALPRELDRLADVLRVQLPWGSLLAGAVKPEPWFLQAVRTVLRQGGRLELVLGYDPSLEDSRVRELGLPPLDESYLTDTLLPAYEASGLTPLPPTRLRADDLRALRSTWARRLAYGAPRQVWLLVFEREGAS